MIRRILCAAAVATAVFSTSAGAADAAGTLLRADQMPWAPVGNGSPLEVVALWGDPASAAHARLLKLPAGFVAPDHAHSGDYHGINLTGTWRHTLGDGSSEDLPPGSYVLQPGGDYHGDACVGSEPCVLLLIQEVAADFLPKP